MASVTAASLGIFWSHTRRVAWRPLGFAASGLILASLAGLAYPQVMKRVFDGMSGGGGVGSGVWMALGLVFALEWCGWRLATYSIMFLETSVMKALDVSCFEAVHSHSTRFFSENFVGSLVKKVNRFSRAYETVADRALFNLLPLAIRIVGALAMLAWLRWELAALLGVWLVVYLALVYALTLYKLRFDVEVVAADTRCTGILADTITNALSISLFNGGPRERASFSAAKEHQRRWRLFAWSISGHVDSVQGALTIALELALLSWGVSLWQAGAISVGDFALIQGLILIIAQRLFEVSRVIKDVYRALADAAEMTEILTQPREVTSAPGARALEVEAGAIALRGVGFGYDSSREVFAGLDLEVEAGERLALVGPSGSGKSTLTKLLLRLYDVQRGAVLIDGQDLKGVTLESARAAVATVPQDPVLFHRPLLDNIRYGRPGATEAEVVEAAKRARCHGFISALPEGYATLVGERGVKLSGGERQRIAIARAMLCDAPVLVLDEATSSLDSESEAEIQEALEALMEGRTTLVIAHRLSTVMSVDRIVVLEAGEVVEQGDHDELLRRGGLYSRLWSLQAGGFLQAA